MRRRGAGEVLVVDASGAEVATICRTGSGRWQVAMAPARVRTLHAVDPEFATRGAALAWLSEVQFP